MSEETAKVIDKEVRSLIDEGYETARTILTEKHEDFERLAQGLLEYETLTGAEILQVIAGNPPSRNQGDDTPPSRGSSVPKAGRPRRGGEPDAGGMEPQPSA